MTISWILLPIKKNALIKSFKSSDIVHGLEKSEFQDLLSLATKES